MTKSTKNDPFQGKAKTPYSRMELWAALLICAASIVGSPPVRSAPDNKVMAEAPPSESDADAKGTLEILKPSVKSSADSVDFTYDYRRAKLLQIDSTRFYVRRGDRELYLASSVESEVQRSLANHAAGRIKCSLPFSYLPAGSYTLVQKNLIHTDTDNRILESTGGRSLIEVPGYDGSNYELSFKGAGVINPFIRSQETLTTDQWNFYYLDGIQNGVVNLMSFTSNLGRHSFRDLSDALNCGTKGGWRNIILRCSGNKLDVSVDGKTLSCVDDQNTFSKGYAGFRSADDGTPAYIDDVRLTDLTTSKVVFSDDFERDNLGDGWKVCGGSWKISKGLPVTEETDLGSFEIPTPKDSKLADVDVVKNGDGLDLLIDGRPVVPLIYSLASTQQGSEYQDTSYQVMKNGYSAGIRLFAPVLTITDFQQGHLDLSHLDDLMAQSLSACPKAYFILRFALPAPPWLPETERVRMAHSQNDPGAAIGNEDTKVETNFDMSLASKTYKKFAPAEMKYIISHMKSQSYGQHVLGLLVTGAGYELDWGLSLAWPSFYIDVSPAQVAHVGAELKKEYGTPEALQKAWGDPSASFEAPSLPSSEDRLSPDIAGFRDPSNPKTRKVLDFDKIYMQETDEILAPIYDAISESAPNSFFGNFYAITLNSEFGTAGAGFGDTDHHALLDHAGPRFLAGIITYGDRMAGGVSASTSMTWESFRMHGKMLLDENDIRPPRPITNEGLTEASPGDLIQTMRREFANTVLTEHNAMWYFDMGYTGPWYDHPFILDELTKEMSVGKAALGVKRVDVAQTLVVLDPNSWQYYASTCQKIAQGEKLTSYDCITYAGNYSTLAVEAMMRMGAPKDFILSEDLKSKNGYKLYIFPTAFHCDDQLRSKITKLASDGAVCVLMGPAGLVDDKSASLDNMTQLLGMKIAFDGPLPLTASMIPSNNPIAAGFTGGEYIGGGEDPSRRRSGNDLIPTWYRFYVQNPNSDIETLATYNNSGGKIAMVMKRVGKGAIIYSGVPITNPAVYRNIAKFSGVHVYLDANDAFYADGNFITIHTAEGGSKKITLLKRAPEVREVFSGQLVGHNVNEFETELPPKHTAVYYIGSDKAILAKLKVIPR